MSYKKCEELGIGKFGATSGPGPQSVSVVPLQDGYYYCRDTDHLAVFSLPGEH